MAVKYRQKDPVKAVRKREKAHTKEDPRKVPKKEQRPMQKTVKSPKKVQTGISLQLLKREAEPERHLQKVQRKSPEAKRVQEVKAERPKRMILKGLREPAPVLLRRAELQEEAALAERRQIHRSMAVQPIIHLKKMTMPRKR